MFYWDHGVFLDIKSEGQQSLYKVTKRGTEIVSVKSNMSLGKQITSISVFYLLG